MYQAGPIFWPSSDRKLQRVVRFGTARASGLRRVKM